MSKITLNKKELFTTRVLILFFSCILAGGVLWAERLANGHQSYIFHHYTPTILPILGGLILLLYGWIVYCSIKKKADPQESKVFSRGFLLYLLSLLLITICFPALSFFAKAPQLFNTVTALAAIALPFHFIAYLVYEKIAPFAAGLCWMTCFSILGLVYFTKTYYSGSSPILAGPELLLLSDWGCLILMTLLFAALYFGWCFLAKFKPSFSAKKIIPLFGFLLSLATLLTLCINPLTNEARTAIFWSVLVIEILCPVSFVLWKKKR